MSEETDKTPDKLQGKAIIDSGFNYGDTVWFIGDNGFVFSGSVVGVRGETQRGYDYRIEIQVYIEIGQLASERWLYTDTVFRSSKELKEHILKQLE